MKTIGILGSTGSIGRQSLAVLSWFPDEYRVKLLAANQNAALLAEQAKKFQPEVIALADPTKYKELKALLPDFCGEILAGAEGIEAVSGLTVDMMIHGIAGMAGLSPLLTTLKAKNKVAFANKESLVTAGHLVMSLVKEMETVLLPVDSEHSAIFQCLLGGKSGLKKLVLTASGGPFRQCTAAQLDDVTPEMALKHPTWNMGAKVTIDSSTMMNKGLEVIEAHWLFDCPYEQIEVLIQPQSVIHSMVCFKDGSFIGHLGKADMRIPIQFALTYPERRENPLTELDFAALGRLDFSAPKKDVFPLLGLAYEVGKAGGTLPAVMNAANEVLVYKFLAKRIKYKDIYRYVAETVANHENTADPSLGEILAAAAETKEKLARI
ncbi:MAG TPA: 1-deoxy-D-xylulose-5-phosphate reductoisomerase [Clostridiales bacterium]|nr:1-deoxy-D-xylulose-5-phosphate reductoisomerase [Clostridiales bacterium]